jgi:hypothetical protein
MKPPDDGADGAELGVVSATDRVHRHAASQELVRGDLRNGELEIEPIEEDDEPQAQDDGADDAHLCQRLGVSRIEVHCGRF